MLTLFRRLWFLIFASWVVYGLWMYQYLPENIIVHFNIQGQPDGWGTKKMFFIVMYLVMGLLNALFYALVSSWLPKIPEFMVNMPSKEYWFSTPELKAKAYHQLRLVLCSAGIFLNSVIGLVLYMTFEKTLDPTSLAWLGSSFAWLALGFAGLFIIWVFILVRPPKKQANPQVPG